MQNAAHFASAPFLCAAGSIPHGSAAEKRQRRAAAPGGGKFFTETRRQRPQDYLIGWGAFGGRLIK